MSQVLIKEMSDTLKSMEAGTLQSFCLDYLPLYNRNYGGLERHGGTADGQTRKGTPDLIKTFGNGEQIAVQCSTEDDYWKKPKDISKWKPCEDIDKCIKTLSNVQEIVLCSNQEISTSNANAKTEIILYAKEKTRALIVLINVSEIEKVLSDNLSNLVFQNIFKKYFPDINERINNFLEASKNKLAVELYQKTPIPMESALKFAKDAIDKYYLDEKEARTYALSKIDELKSKFERFPIPKPGNIERYIPENFLILNPIGKIQSILGVPKIGKTYLVAQCAKYWESKSLNVKWFDCPFDKIENISLGKVISRDIWNIFLPPEKATEISEGISSLESIDANSLKYKSFLPTVYVLDNAEYIPEDELKKLHFMLAKIKKLDLINFVGVVFLSNKTLKHLCQSISNELSSPPWTREEIKKILSEKLSEYSYEKNDKYLEMLEAMSGGHPLVAVALARKYLSITELFSSNFQLSMVDEDLAADVKNLLFEDILTDNDSLLFVLRLSQLIYRANTRVMQIIVDKIDPKIVKPFSLILDKLRGTVIEGDERQGYVIAYVYKKVANEKTKDTQLQQEIFEAVSNELLKPINNILNANEISDGIVYALLAKKFKDAFHWSTVLLKTAIDKNVSKRELNVIIDRIEIISAINCPNDSDTLIKYYKALISLSFAYVRIEVYGKAIIVLNKIKMPDIKYVDKNKEEYFELFIKYSKGLKMLLLSKDDPIKSIEALSEIDFNKMNKDYSIKQLNILNVLKNAILKLPLKGIDKNILNKIINSVNLKDEAGIAIIVSIALHLGVKAKNEQIEIDEIMDYLPLGNPFGAILENTVRAQYALEKKDTESAVKYVEKAINLCQENQLLYQSVENVLKLLQGDIYYLMNDYSNARIAYLRSLVCQGKNKKTFDYAWAIYKLGLISTEPSESEKYLREASATFNFLGYEDSCARSEGERGVTLVQLGKYYEFVRIAEWMCRRYYVNKKISFGPAVTVVVAHLERLTAQLENRSINLAAGMYSPEFEKNVYTRVLGIAKPRADGLLAFYILGELYGHLGNISRKIKCLRMSINSEAIIKLSFDPSLLVINSFLSGILPNGSKKEIRNSIIRGISVKNSQWSLRNSSHMVFSAFDNIMPELDEINRKEFIMLLTEIESEIKKANKDNLAWWLAEIYLREAQLTENLIVKSERYYLWDDAYKKAIESNNYDVTVISAHELCFIYPEFSKSIKDISDKQLEMIKAISLSNQDLKELEAIGNYLYNFWKGLQWNRLNEHDLIVVHTLMDGAKSLKSVSLHEKYIAPIMIILLASIYNHKDSAVNWAVEKIATSKYLIPKDVFDKISLYFKND
ncbi:MAG: hypothetical protein PHX78_11335 [bacterium]|nr:hypothetical protein [bacterium]